MLYIYSNRIYCTLLQIFDKFISASQDDLMNFHQSLSGQSLSLAAAITCRKVGVSLNEQSNTPVQ